MDHYKLLRKIWPLLREHMIDPTELIPHIRGLNENDIESIRAGYNTSKMTAIDRLYDALRRRDINCFYSFLIALTEHDYKPLAQEIMRVGGINEASIPGMRRTTSNTRPPSTPTGGQVSQPIRGSAPEVVTQSYTSSEPTSNVGNSAQPIDENAPLTKETVLADIVDSIFEKWAKKLNERNLWRSLAQKLNLTRHQVKSLEAKNNPGEAVLDLLIEKRVVDLLQLLEGDQRFSDLIQCIREDLGESDYNNLNINPLQPVSGDKNNEGFITVNLGPSSRNDSTSNLQNNENVLSASPTQNQSSSPESCSEKSSKISSTSKSLKFQGKKFPDKSFKSTTEGVTLTGQDFSYDGEISAQKVPPSVIQSRESESCRVNSVIAETQREIARENERKSEILDTSMTNADTDIKNEETESFHQTSPKSSFLDDNLNDPQDFFKENMTSSTKNISGHHTKSNAKHDSGREHSNLDVNSVISESRDESRSEVTEVTVQPEVIQTRGPIAHNEQIDSNEEGSSIVKAANDLRKELEDISLGEKPNVARPSGNFINIPVQTTGCIEEGSPVAAPESAIDSGLDLFGSCPPQLSTPAEQRNIGVERQSDQCTTRPVPVSDDSEVKNPEMEARAFRSDIQNPAGTQDFRDIQNSMPDEDIGANEGSVNSIVNQYDYNAEVSSRGQSRHSDLSDTQNSFQETVDISGSENLSSALNNVVSLSDSLSTNTGAATVCSNK